MRIQVIAICLLLTLPASVVAADSNRSEITLDEDVWVLFYDVPSRRFRNVRDAFVRRDWPIVRRDLEAGAGFLRAELARADAILVDPLKEIIVRLEWIAENIESREVSGSDLDSAFAKTHWLLAQHYLILSESSKTSGDARNTANYLWATTHHLERCVMWSDARLTRRQLASLEKLRDMAGQLRTTDDPATVYKSKPVANARKTLRDIGEFLDRRVRLPAD